MKTIYNILILASFCLVSCKYSKEEYQAAVDVAYDEGFVDGEPVGYTTGYSKGETDGYSKGYTQAINDHAPAEYWQGKEDGYIAGDNQGAFNRGYGDGVQIGYQNGYSTGYSDGDADGYSEGYEDGFDDNYSIGYSDGLARGIFEGYGIGYDDGLDDGYDLGFDDGYDDGFDRSYGDGLDDGYDIGLDDGYDSGYGDGYDSGYDDGWFEAGGSSTGSKKQAQSLAKTFLKDLINFGSLKSPKQVLSDPKNRRALLSSSSGMTVDTMKKKAILNKYVVGAMKNQLIQKYGLSEKRSLQIAKLANHMIDASKTGEMNVATVNRFSKKVLGSDFQEMQDAYKSSLQGNLEEMNALVQKAAALNEITPEHTLKVMTQLFL